MARRPTPGGVDELEQELRYHLDRRIDDFVAAGLPLDEARRRAALEFGGVLQTQEAIRDDHPWRALEALAQDLRFAIRSLRRAPAFALTAIVVMALGIGANTAVFTIVNTVLLRPMPFDRADDVVVVQRRTPFGSSRSFSLHDYVPLTAERRTLAALAVIDVMPGRNALLTAGGAEAIRTQSVSGEFFEVLGVHPVVGRLFDRADGVPGHPLTAVITDEFWKRRFGADRRVVGTSLTVGGRLYALVGVAPDGVRAFSAVDMFLSLQVPAASSDRANSFQVLARVTPGVTLDQAEAAVDITARQHARNSPALTNMPQGIVLRRVQEALVANVRPALEALTVAVSLVLLVACANVANLVLARATSGRREIAVMAALGASRWRIGQRVVAESATVAICGGLGALALASIAVRTLPLLRVVNLPQLDRVSVDVSVVAYVAAVTLVAGLFAGVPPAWQLAREDLVPAMKDGGPQAGSGRGGRRVRVGLTMAQVALSTILLVCAGLLTRSFWKLVAVDPGFRVDDVLTMTVGMAPDRYPDSARVGAFTDELAARLERIPGVVAASPTTALPSQFPIDFPVSVPGRADGSSAGGSTPTDAWYRAINGRYFSAMGIPLKRGRVFAEADSAAAAPVVIVSEALARSAFPNSEPLGQSLIIGKGYLTAARDLRPRVIVGVVGDTRERGLRFDAPPTIYVPVAQAPEPITKLVIEKIPMPWVLRLNGEVSAIVPKIRETVLSIDRTQPPADFAALADVLGQSIASYRFNMIMLTIFSMLSLLLAATGVYGLTAYAVAQRRREIGIRLSLGAAPRRVVRDLVAEGLWVSGGGIAAGLVAAGGAGRLLSRLLFGLAPIDPASLITALITMLAIAATATYLPASRAAAIDPMLTLRSE